MQEARKTVLLEIQNLWAAYGSDLVLHDISFQLNAGEMLAIIGPNGGGKTTLLKTILGLHKPLRGRILYNSKVLKRFDRRIAYVPQQATFRRDCPASVRQLIELAFVRSLHPLVRLSQSQKDKCDQLIQELDLHEISNKQVTEISGGQLQRVLVARALVCKPELLLLDEPLSNLDTENTRLIMQHLLSNLNKSAVIMNTHNVAVLPRYFNQLACLNRKMHYHGAVEINATTLNEVYGCEVDLIAHGLPHRVLSQHPSE